jgi:asparagine synthase (glutamine-hydrolysing)
MTERLRHRGPDDSGAFVDPAAGIALGFRRLSILDLTAAGHQPMVSDCGRFIIVFNGEVYNHGALRTELKRLGHRFRGHSDTEVLLEAISAWGLRAGLERLNGMFAFGLWDRKERSLSLARDRLGEKPLYYGWSGGVFLFGSELKALRAHPAFVAELDRDALALYLRHNYLPSPYCIYRGFAKLSPGHFLVLDDGRRLASSQPYWSARDAVLRGLSNPFRGNDREAIEELDELLRDAVKLRMEADVPLGAFLSGGIDSSTVVALMQAQSERPVRTFSIGFHEDGYNEAHHAKAVAAHLGTDHTELYVEEADVLATVGRMPTIYDEPFGDSSQIPTLLVSQLARRDVAVSLSGDGGDELFGGYPRYLATKLLWRSIRHFPAPIRKLAGRLIRWMPPSTLDRSLGFTSFALDRYGRPGVVGEKLHKAAALLEQASFKSVYRGAMSYWPRSCEPVLGGTAPPTILMTDIPLPVRDPIEWMMYVDAVMYLPDDILVKVDRASMSVSLEARVPMLDHRIFEFSWRLPFGMRVRRSKTKWLLRQVLARYVPESLFERPKMGFGVPISAWLRGPLREWAEALLDETRMRREGLLDVEAVNRRWREHRRGDRDWEYSLWGLLMFQAWLETSR